MTPENISYLYSLTNEFRSIKYDLRNMQAFAAALGNPQDAFGSILIAGTNGKGSVAAMLSAMMPEAGLYTSPHLVRLNERIRIGPAEISNAGLEDMFQQARTAATSESLLYSPTYFEMVTAMAFVYFRSRVKFAVLEVGLGGRLDATNIVKQKVSVITSIGLDHERFLGSTLEEIAAEKAGIIKGSEPVVVGSGTGYAAICEKAGNQLVRADEVWRDARPAGSGRFELDVRTPVREYRRIRLSLPGRHQVENAVVAIRAAECLGWTGDAIQGGLETAQWPGRLEPLGNRPEFLLDGAHNPHACRALAGFLSEFHSEGVWMIFGVMADKHFDEMIGILAPHVRQWILTRVDYPRALDPETLAERIPGSIVRDGVESAIDYARSSAPAGTTVAICGSLYLVGAARALLLPDA